jgi:NADH-quinone oxidoreductase subunit L
MVLGPLLAAALGGLLQRYRGDKVATAVTTGAVGLSLALSLPIFADFVWGEGHERLVELFTFIDVAGFTSTWSVRIDALSAVMLVVVNTVSFLVHVYSIGYMAEDPHRARFFSYLSFFTFAMLALVTANDFLQLFFGWEGVGVASYLLIGFWYQKRSAPPSRPLLPTASAISALPWASWPRSWPTARSSTTRCSQRRPRTPTSCSISVRCSCR